MNQGEIFLALIRLGIDHQTCDNISVINWNEIKALAYTQGLSAVIIDGIEKLPEGKRPPLNLLLQWIGEVLQDYEQRYEAYRHSIAKLAEFYNSHGYKMMVLKGYACSLDWPKPEHRPCGDIDIWQFGEYKKADKLLLSEKGIKVDSSHHHHTVFNWGGFSVENHYDFINIYRRKSNVFLEQILKELGKDNSHSVEIDGEKIHIPSPDLHALFLLCHSLNDFAVTTLTIRQVIDWGFFVEKHGSEVNWEQLLEILEKNGMIQMFNIINAICVDDLYFDSCMFPYIQFDPVVKEKVLREILFPYIPNEKSHVFFKRVIWKCRRWKANEWKRTLCFKESLWSAFWSGVKSHVLKPASI